MEKDTKVLSVLELPLAVEKWQEKRLINRYDNVTKIYNAMRRYEWNKVRQLKQTKEWRENLDDSCLFALHKQIDELKINSKSSKEDKEKEKEIKTQIKEIYNRRNELYKENNLTKFGFIYDLKKFSKPYSSSVPSVVAQISIASVLWRAFESCLYSKGNIPKYRKYDDTRSFSSDGKSAIILLKDEKGYYLRFQNKQAKAKSMDIRIKLDKTDYNLEMISRKIKIITIVRKQEKTKTKFYVQFCVEGIPFKKIDKDGNLIHNIGDGVVGLSIWRNKLCAVSDNEAVEFELTPNIDKYLEELNALTKKQEEIRRRLNPQNYEDNGVIKKGIINIETGKKEKLKWTYSNTYREISRQRRELCRVYREQRKIYINKIIYKLLEMGNTFIIPEYNFNTEKDLFDEENRLSNTEYKKKKDRRRAIQNGAPATFLAALDNKLLQYNVEKINRIKINKDEYWYCHLIDESNKSLFYDDFIKLPDGKTFPHTLYRAFLIKYYDENLKKYNRNKITENFNKFMNII